ELPIKNLKLNPFYNAPLSLTLEIDTPLSGKFVINVLGQDGSKSNILLKPKYNGRNHKLEIFGLYPDYTNTIEISFVSDKGYVRKTQQISVKTSKMPDGFPSFNIVKKYDNFDQNTLILVNYRKTNAHLPFMVDPFGKIRWYSTGFSNTGKYALQKFKNGNIGFGVVGGGQGKIYEYSMTGQIIQIYDVFPEYENIHHDVFEMPNGNLLVTVDKVGIDTVEDHILEIDRISGSIQNVWDLREVLPTDRFTLRKIGDGRDWFHTNAVIYDDRDNSLILSGQAQGLVKVSWDNKLKWILAPHEGWGDEYKDFLLNPDSNPFDWAWGQHAPLILPNGNLMLFDNGFGRNFSNQPQYSRVVEYDITESNIGGTISQIWDYGKERGEDMFSPFISDVDYLEKSSSVFITAGSTAFDLTYVDFENQILKGNIDQIETRIIEVNKEKEVLFEMTVESTTLGSTYRSEKILINL
ncbi:aryl-sulfate sulfotransferase, partial [Flavobacteriaceae bacterium]|nr:aryl-sulfate sulfotransferase [Flavobacteriaceae bacterium]